MLKPLRTALLILSAGAATAAPPAKVRFATYNVSFFRPTAGALFTELTNTPASVASSPTFVHRVAEALQRIRPDVVLLNEFDYDAGASMNLFADKFLATPQKTGLEALSYPFRYTAPSNTGVSSGFDLDNNGTTVTAPGTEAYGNDSFGFGTFPGQYGMVVYSRYPIETSKIRTLQLFKWKDMPNSRLLLNSGNPPLTTYYSAEEHDVLRLSSKTHLDVPINLGGGILAHLLASHPTPPTFDSTEDKNGKRNFDEIRLWADYIDPGRSSYIYDDNGVPGGLPRGARFVIEGDQNADPNDGDTLSGAARQLTQHPLVNASFTPSSGTGGGGDIYSTPRNGQLGNPLHDTAAFSGGLRVDYVLPSRAGFNIAIGAVFWPGPSDPLKSLIADREPSDHHMVWMDLLPDISLAEAVGNLTPAWTGSGVRLTWQASAGYAYRIQQSPSLTAGSWTDTGIIPSVSPLTFEATAVIPPGGAGKWFYRLEVSFAP